MKSWAINLKQDKLFKMIDCCCYVIICYLFHINIQMLQMLTKSYIEKVYNDVVVYVRVFNFFLHTHTHTHTYDDVDKIFTRKTIKHFFLLMFRHTFMSYCWFREQINVSKCNIYMQEKERQNK